MHYLHRMKVPFKKGLSVFSSRLFILAYKMHALHSTIVPLQVLRYLHITKQQVVEAACKPPGTRRLRGWFIIIHEVGPDRREQVGKWGWLYIVLSSLVLYKTTCFYRENSHSTVLGRHASFTGSKSFKNGSASYFSVFHFKLCTLYAA